MLIQEFDVMDTAEASDLVRSCADVPGWVGAVVAGRPYDDAQHLFARAAELAATWTELDVARALADHPRIGERHAGSGESAAMSAREQSGVDPTDADVQERLAEGNRAYEERFDRIFLIRAAGRSASEVLAQLEARLANDPVTELQVTAQQLREIADLRLRGLFT